MNIWLRIIFIWFGGSVILFIIYLNNPKFMNDPVVFALAILTAMFTAAALRDLVYQDTSDDTQKILMVNKLMTCSLRKKHGLNYCGICPDGYSCALGADLNDIK